MDENQEASSLKKDFSFFSKIFVVNREFEQSFPHQNSSEVIVQSASRFSTPKPTREVRVRSPGHSRITGILGKEEKRSGRH